MQQQQHISRFFQNKAGRASRLQGEPNHKGKRQRTRSPALEASHKDQRDTAPSALPLEVAAVASMIGRAALTPLEQQVVVLKAAAPDALLLVQNGYKFMGFGEDAPLMARELDVVAFERGHLLVAGFPTGRLPVHLYRLLVAGHRVAIARQSESAAERAVAGCGGTTFARQISEVVTLATYGGHDSTCDGDGGGGVPSSRSWANPPPVMLCVHEAVADGGVASLSLLTIDVGAGVATGEVHLEPDGRRPALASRLEALTPVQLLLPPAADLSAATMLTISEYRAAFSALPRRPAGARQLRTTHADALAFTADAAISRLFPHGGASGGDVGRADCHRGLDSLLRLPGGVLRCVGAACEPLEQAGQLALLSSPPEIVATAPLLRLGSSVLRDLHVFRPAGSSLLRHLDRTLTPFGGRTLRGWLSTPLADADAIQRRIDAVAELRAAGLPGTATGPTATGPTAGLSPARRPCARGPPTGLVAVVRSLEGAPDVESILARVARGRASPRALHAACLLLRRAGEAMPAAHRVHEGGDGVASAAAAPADAPRSELLRRLLTIEPHLLRQLTCWSELLRPAAKGALADELCALFCPAADVGAHASCEVDVSGVAAARAAVERLAAQLETEVLRGLRRVLQVPALRYAQTSGREAYTIDVPLALLGRVPPAWLRVGQSKGAVRFRPPEAEALLPQLELLRERHRAEASAAWGALQARVAAVLPSLRALLARLSSLDALLALASVAASEGYCEPDIIGGDAPPTLHVVAGRHPCVDTARPFVPNAVRLGGGDGRSLAAAAPRCMILCGPNCGGKSVFLRQAGLIALLAQIGSFVPAEACALTPLRQLHTRMGASDDIMHGVSTFSSEMRSTSEVSASGCDLRPRRHVPCAPMRAPPRTVSRALTAALARVVAGARWHRSALAAAARRGWARNSHSRRRGNRPRHPRAHRVGHGLALHLHDAPPRGARTELPPASTRRAFPHGSARGSGAGDRAI